MTVHKRPTATKERATPCHSRSFPISRLKDGEKVSPSSPTNPNNGYGIAKLAAGKMSRILCSQLGIRHIWCRILSAYGPGDGAHTMVMSTIIKFLNGEDCDFTKGEQQWDFLYNGDIANAFYLAAEKGRDGAIYTVGSGKTRSLKDYITDIRDIACPSAKCNFGESIISQIRLCIFAQISTT